MLSSLAVTNAKPRDKAYKLSDGNGLTLLIQPTGKKLWRFRYRHAGKENMLAFGAYPDVGLADARDRRDAARKQLAQGIDPSQQKKLDKLAAATAAHNTFGAIAQEYIDGLKAQGRAEGTIEKNRWALLDLAKPLADRPITEITAAEILDLLKKIEKTGRRVTARRVRSVVGAVFRLAIATLRATTDPTFALRGALLKPNVTHRPAITDEPKLGALMTAIETYDGWPTIRAALQFQALTMTRPGDVRHMRRPEVNFLKAVWKIPAERMKMRREHEVPLSTQALAILSDVWELSEGDGLVFPSIRSGARPLSENAFNSALRRMGYRQDEMVAHGFRSSASTILNERGFNPDHIEAALAHQDEDEIRRAYNRTTYFKERVGLMQAWADLLDQFKTMPIQARA